MSEKGFLGKKIEIAPLHTLFPLSTDERSVDYDELRRHLRVMAVSHDDAAIPAPAPSIGGPPPADDVPMGQEMTYVCSGFAFRFDATTTHHAARIVLMSSLFAQMVADKASPRTSDEWWTTYAHWMSLQGWIMSELQWAPVDLQGQDDGASTVHQVLALTARDLAEATAPNFCNEMCNTLLSNIDSPQFAVFESKSTAPGAVSLAPIVQYSDDVAKSLSVSNVANVYIVSAKHKAFLWWAWLEGTATYYGVTHSETLNYESWDNVEAIVEEKLKDFAPLYIGPLS